MADVKALFPIGKTQWAKWDNTKREAFNTIMAGGQEFNTAVNLVNSMPKAVEKANRIIDVFHEVEDIVEEVAPVIAAAVKAVRRPRTKKVK